MKLKNLRLLGILLTTSLFVAGCGSFSTNKTNDYCTTFELVALTDEQGTLLPENKFLAIDKNDADYLCRCKNICFKEPNFLFGAKN